jgi:DNA repair protein RadC
MMSKGRKSHKNLCPVCEHPIKVAKDRSLYEMKDILACLTHFRDKRQEYFICLSVSSAQRLIAWRVVTIGTLTSSLAHPREVFAGALTDSAASVIIAHNHPSDDPNPSKQDITTTNQLIAAGQILGVPLQDHIIITKTGYYSFRHHSLI